jgi:SNF2 family DNA or RNA helicase
LKLSQFTGGFVTTDDDQVLQSNTAKLDELNQILDEFADKKIVIFCRFIAEIEAIGKLLTSKKINYSEIYGQTKDRQNQVEKFQNDPDTKVFLGQIATAGMGITLTSAHTTIYYSLDFSYQNYEQSRSRTFRIGQTYPCTYIHLLVEDSIDNLVYTALQNKKDIAKQIVDDYNNTKQLV